MRLLHSIRSPEQAVGSDGVVTLDLPVNPLSAILVNLRPLNDTGTVANYQRLIGLAAALNRVSVLHLGASVFSMRGEDAVALAFWRHGILPWVANEAHTDNDRRMAMVPVILGRKCWDPKSCFPASRRGELTLELDFDIADTGYDGLRYSVETIELIDANPKEFERSTVISQTMGSGTNDVSLPLGNWLRGVLCYGTTGFAGANPAPTLGRMATYVDNEQHSYAAIDFESARTLFALQGRMGAMVEHHNHQFTGPAEAALSVTTNRPVMNDTSDWQRYCYLDFDPSRDDEFSLDLSGSASAFLRVEAESADAARFISVERVAL